MLSTQSKISIASAISRCLLGLRRTAGLSSRVSNVRRRGTIWNLDLSEGVDLAIYLGIYELSTYQAIKQLVSPGSVVLDIGANIGAYTLPLAKMVGSSGIIHAFEPTQYAFSRLGENIALNAELAPRISANQLMLSNGENQLETEIYSSWPLSRETSLHAVHGGRANSTEGGKADSLDNYLRQNNVNKVDFVKLDVDGFEVDVLSGANLLFEKHRPEIIMEFAPYCLDERGTSIETLISHFIDADYEFAPLGKPVRPTGSILERIPTGGSVNVVASPKGRSR